MENSENKLTHGTIYKLSDNEGHFYFGSTTLILRERYAHHKFSSKIKCRGSEKYQTFTYEKFCNDDIKIEIIEEVVVESIRELKKIENQYIVKYRNDLKCLNKYKAFQTDEEKKQYKHSGKMKEKDKEYRERNKEKRKQKISCVCGAIVANGYITKHKRTKKHQDFVNANPM